MSLFGGEIKWERKDKHGKISGKRGQKMGCNITRTNKKQMNLGKRLPILFSRGRLKSLEGRLLREHYIHKSRKEGRMKQEAKKRETFEFLRRRQLILQDEGNGPKGIKLMKKGKSDREEKKRREAYGIVRGKTKKKSNTTEMEQNKMEGLHGSLCLSKERKMNKKENG